MADIKDILGVSRAAGADGNGPPAPQKKEKEPKMKRPEGMSREAFALLGNSHPIITSQFASSLKKPDLLKKQPKPSTKGIPTYQHKRFINPARSDGLELTHWVKCYKGANGTIKDPEEEYSFAKYNKKVVLTRYDDEEYQSLIRPVSGDWTRAETDYLYSLLDRYDLRWPVIADRYEYEGGGPARCMEDLKARYYSVARTLLISREGGEAGVANSVLVKHPYSRSAEMERKAALERLLARTPQQLAEENVILAEAKLIEERRKADAAAALKRASAPPAPITALQRTGSPAAARPSPLAAAAPSGIVAGGAALPAAAAGLQRGASPGPLGNSDLLDPEVFPDPPLGVCSLFGPDLRPAKVKGGVYSRGLHARAVAATMANSMSGGSRAHKAVEVTLQDMWPSALFGSTVCTRTVCGMWLALRAEVIAQHELKRNLQNRISGGDGAGGGSLGGAGLGGKRPEKRKK